MKRYVIYNTDGEIVRSVTCDETNAAIQCQTGESILESDSANEIENHVFNDEIAFYTDSQKELKSQNRQNHTWSNATMNWIDNRDIDHLKSDKLLEMKTARDTAVNGGFMWDFSIFDSDEISQMRILGLYIASQQTNFPATAWRLQNNSWRLLNKNDVSFIWDNLQEHIRVQFTKFASKEFLVNQAVNKAQIEDIVW